MERVDALAFAETLALCSLAAQGIAIQIFLRRRLLMTELASLVGQSLETIQPLIAELQQTDLFKVDRRGWISLKLPPHRKILAADWQPSPEQRSIASKLGLPDADVERQIIRFRGYFSSGKRAALQGSALRWNQRWQDWISNETKPKKMNGHKLYAKPEPDAKKPYIVNGRFVPSRYREWRRQQAEKKDES